MKIAFFTDNFFPEISGISDSIAATTRELGARGHEVKIFAPRATVREFRVVGAGPHEINLGHRVSVERLPSVPVPMATGQARAVLPIFFPTLSKLRRWRPDIVHAHTFFGAGLEALAASRVLGIPLIGTNHTAVGSFTRQLPLGVFLENPSVRAVSFFYNRCTFVSTPSQALLDEMRLFGFRKDGGVISNPVDTELFAPAKARHAELKQAWKLSRHTIVYAGRFAEEKYIDVLIRAVARVRTELPDAELLLAGHGSARRSLEQLADKLGCKDAIRFVGTLSHAHLAELYQASELFAIASTSETQSMVLLQAMATGLPVVGVNARALPEYIRDGERGLLVDSGNDHEMASAMVLLLRDPSLREVMGEHGRQAALEFGVGAIATQWEIVYKKILQRA